MIKDMGVLTGPFYGFIMTAPVVTKPPTFPVPIQSLVSGGPPIGSRSVPRHRDFPTSLHPAQLQPSHVHKLPCALENPIGRAAAAGEDGGSEADQHVQGRGEPAPKGDHLSACTLRRCLC